MLHKNNFIVYDLETGGLSCEKSPMIEVALIVLDNDLKVIDKYENLIKPYLGFDGIPLILYPQALQINGISEARLLKEGKEAEVVYHDLIKLFQKHTVEKYKKPILVGHNIVKFDNLFLSYFFNVIGKAKDDEDLLLKYVEEFSFDTMWYSRMKWGNIEVVNHKLEGLCERFGVPITDSHRAMNDVEANAEAFVKIMKDIRVGNNTVVNFKEVGEIPKRNFSF